MGREKNNTLIVAEGNEDFCMLFMHLLWLQSCY